MALPVHTGSLSVVIQATNSLRLKWPAATVDSGSPTYDVSLNGGSSYPVTNLTALFLDLPGLGPGNTYNFWVRAKDSSAQYSTPALQLSVAMPTTDPGDVDAPTLTGELLFTEVTTTQFRVTWPAAASPLGLSMAYDIAFSAAGTSFPIANVSGNSYLVTGQPANSSYTIAVRAKDTFGRTSRPLLSKAITLAVDTTGPTLTDPTATATGATTATGSVSTNEAPGTLYRLASVNATETAATVKAAALTTAVAGTGPQSVAFTGLTAATAYYAHYVHRDAAGNDSAVASTSASFTTSAAPSDSTPPVLSGSITITNLGGNSFTATAPVATDAGGGITYEYSTDGGTGWGVVGWPTPTYNFSGFSTGALVQLRMRAKDGAGNYSTPLLAAAVQLTATPDAPASITTHPQSSTTVTGATVTLTYGATGSPAPTRTLQRSVNGGVSWSPVAGAGTTSYTTPALTAQDNGVQYRLVATNEIGSNQYTATSNVAVITLSDVVPGVPILIGVTLPSGLPFFIP